MRHLGYVDMVTRAVHDKNPDRLHDIARQLADNEEARSILRMKGYGTIGTTAANAARAVPSAKPDRDILHAVFRKPR